MSAFNIKEHILEAQHIRHFARATNTSQEDVLRLAIKQYTPKDNLHPGPGDVTIIGAHANGFPKELYEPLWEELYARSKDNGFKIRSIWIADNANQSASETLNEDLLGNDPGWLDHSRDLLHMINHFRKEMPLPIVGIGHSLGSAQLVQLSYIHPRLLTTLILLDPVFMQGHSPLAPDIKLTKSPGSDPARLSTFRRDLWPSREAAETAFRSQPFYRSWDVRVLDRWLKYGLRETPTAIYPNEKPGSVTLACSKHQEVFTFMRPVRSIYEETMETTANLGNDPSKWPLLYRPEPPNIFDNLPTLRPSALYIFGEKSPMSEPWMQDSKMAITGTGVGGSGGVAKGRVKKAVLENIGHLVAMEAVELCADAAAPWLGETMKIFSEQEKRYQEWFKLDKMQQMTISEDYKKAVGGPFPKREKGKI